ncbi:MAG TPA: glycine cleavage system protein GcvH [Candidatus Eremiobacteraceae bacterium]|nr:glycine cleavage system protein GcvH [Candidatus Eremiobacteraceae bacterium]
MPLPDDRKYTKEHEWVKFGSDTAVVGITDYAQSSLGDIVYVELPKPGAKLERAKPIGVVESVKAVSDIYAPISGTVTEINSAVEDDPAKVNRDPFGEGWLVKLRMADPKESDGLLDAAAYDDLVNSLSH